MVTGFEHVSGGTLAYFAILKLSKSRRFLGCYLASATDFQEDWDLETVPLFGLGHGGGEVGREENILWTGVLYTHNKLRSVSIIDWLIIICVPHEHTGSLSPRDHILNSLNHKSVYNCYVEFFLDFWLIFCFSLKLETVCFFVSEQTYKFSRESNNCSPCCIYFNNLNL